MEYVVFPAIFFIGVLTKFVDLAVDDSLNIPKPLVYASAVAYGILAAYVITNYTILAPLGLAVVAAVLITGKIDRKPHALGVVIMVLFMFFWGLQAVDPVLLLILLAAGIADEITSDLADKGKVKGVSAKVLGRRFILEVAAFFVSLSTGYWIIFLGILIFDAGYFIAEMLGKKFK